ncbi:hypothetical protein [Epilithonimonas sp.]|uniref:hypothetical protein n=1 Tax=Epilithonimonas sp. TaxID=2894511 RepID=UPI0035B3A516
MRTQIMRKKFLLLIISLFKLNTISSQLLELPKNIQSPNAASIGKYGDVPMNLYTGRADVNIPLYSLNEGGIQLDINLNYDTGGVRVNDVPGWVGQNWSLNAGGVITRSQRGKGFDEAKTCANVTGSDSNWGFKYYGSDLTSSNWSESNNIKNLIHNYMNDYGNNKDYEPDVFTFNFMGYSGRFFLGNDGQWKVSSKDNLKVEILDSDYRLPFNIKYFGTENAIDGHWKRCPSIGKIKIIDDQGNMFIFGKSENDVEFTINDYMHQSELALYPNAWYLSEVYNKYGNRIYLFEYERGSDQGSLYLNARYYSISRDACGMYGYCNFASNDIYDGDAQIYGNLIKPVFLTKISTYSGNKINFNSENNISLKYDGNDPIINWSLYIRSLYYDNLVSGGQSGQAWIMFNHYYWYSVHTPINNGDPVTENPIYAPSQTGSFKNSLLKIITEWKWRKLNSINVINSNNNIVKNIQLVFNNNPSQRLRLDKISIDSQYNYSFEYQNFELLPTFTSPAFDHHGYYNGNNYAFDPIDKNNHYTNRQPNFNFTKYGSLTKITYPTGGYTNFQYEPNTFSKYVSNDKQNLIIESGIAGGLRVSKITNYNGNNSKIYEYLYQNSLTNTSSSGNLLTKNIYYVSNFAGITQCGSNFYETIFGMNSIVPLSNFFGSHIEYPIVFERMTDGNGNNLGYTKYEYNSYIDYKDNMVNTVQPSFSIFDPRTDFSFRRGTLKNKSIFDKYNTIKSEEIYNYSITPNNKLRALSYDIFGTCFLQNAPGVPPGTPDGNPGLKGTAYEIYYSDNNLINKTVRTYDDNGNYLSETESYTYSDRENFGDRFLKSKSKTTTNNETLKEEYQYTFDKSNTTPYNTLTSRREFSIVKTDKTIDNTALSSSQVDYSPFVINMSNGATQIFPQKYLLAKGSNSLEEKLIIDAYDSDGNILQAHRPDGKYIFYFYAYNNRYPIMKVEGPKDVPVGKQPFSYYASILKTKVEAATPDMTDIIKNQFYTVSYYPEHKITCYTYKPDVGVTSIMNPNASVEYYNYDSIGRLISIKDINGKILKDFAYELENQ